jgi:hypothetical protein
LLLKIPNNKPQITNKLQLPKFKIPNLLILKRGKQIERIFSSIPENRNSSGHWHKEYEILPAFGMVFGI